MKLYLIDTKAPRLKLALHHGRLRAAPPGASIPSILILHIPSHLISPRHDPLVSKWRFVIISLTEKGNHCAVHARQGVNQESDNGRERRARLQAPRRHVNQPAQDVSQLSQQLARRTQNHICSHTLAMYDDAYTSLKAAIRSNAKAD